MRFLPPDVSSKRRILGGQCLLQGNSLNRIELGSFRSPHDLLPAQIYSKVLDLGNREKRDDSLSENIFFFEKKDDCLIFYPSQKECEEVCKDTEYELTSLRTEIKEKKNKITSGQEQGLNTSHELTRFSQKWGKNPHINTVQMLSNWMEME